MYFHDSVVYLDFLNTLYSTSDFTTRCCKKASLSHGWRIDAGHVRYNNPASKYLENQIYEACEKHSINFTKYESRFYLRLLTSQTQKPATRIVWRVS